MSKQREAFHNPPSTFEERQRHELFSARQLLENAELLLAKITLHARRLERTGKGTTTLKSLEEKYRALGTQLMTFEATHDDTRSTLHQTRECLLNCKK